MRSDGEWHRRLEIALRAIRIAHGGECIRQANTFIAIDCADDKTYLIDPDGVEAAVTPRTRAIIPVHLFG